jgi:hypothetical protein
MGANKSTSGALDKAQMLRDSVLAMMPEATLHTPYKLPGHGFPGERRTCVWVPSIRANGRHDSSRHVSLKSSAAGETVG